MEGLGWSFFFKDETDIDLELINWIKTKQDPWNDVLNEYLKYESSLSQLPSEFLEELESILKVIGTSLQVDLGQCLGEYIPTYPVDLDF